jgi:hypothetical protein
MSKLVSTPLKQWCLDNGVLADGGSISDVKTSEGGFKFMTFWSKTLPKQDPSDDTGATSIWFSVREAGKLIDGQTPEQLNLSGLNVIETTNKAGEARLKLGRLVQRTPQELLALFD